jgi:hypothetical protein
MKTINDLERPDVVTFLASVPADDELARLTETYTAAMAHVTTLQARTDAARQDIARIDERLMAAPEEQSKLLTQRSQQMAALEVYPAQLVEAIRRRGLAHLYWLARLREVALAEATRADEAITPHMTTIISMRKRLDRDDAHGAGYRQIGEGERATLAEQRAATIAEMSHDQQQLQRAQEVAAVAQGRAQMVYGEGIALEQPALWTAALEQRARYTHAPAGRLGQQHSSVV